MDIKGNSMKGQKITRDDMLPALAYVPAGVTEEEIEQRRERYRKLLRLPPEIAGETIVRGIERRQARVLVGSDAKVISAIVRLLPVSYLKVLARLYARDE